MPIEMLRKFLASLRQPRIADSPIESAHPQVAPLDLLMLIAGQPPREPPGTRYPLHEATLFIKLPDLATLSPDQALAWREVLRWELEVLSRAYQALDPALDGLNWFTWTAD